MRFLNNLLTITAIALALSGCTTKQQTMHEPKVTTCMAQNM